MSYHIEYNPEVNIRYPILKVKKRNKGSLAALFVFCAAVASLVIMKSGLLHFLIPGDPEVTIEAFSTMVEQIETGTSVGESLRSFCKEIIANAS